ncbi:MAG: metal ABC transporter permease [Bacteroidetes bacterium]|nr:metal ABC transporter permease [Bacteroidota bacterium]
MNLIQYDFFSNALLAAIFTSLSCGIIGTYIVSKRIVFISGGITHTSFGGVGLGYFAGINPLIGAAIFSLLSAFGIEFLSKKTDVREDSAIAIMWSFGMAIGVIFVYLTPGYAPNLMSYLFGSILTVSDTEIILIATLSLIILVFFLLFYKIILFIAFDEEFSLTRNIPVVFFNYLLMALIALTIVLSIKVAGIILILSLLTIPQAAANLFVKNFSSIAFWSVLIGFTGALTGLLGSYWWNIPSGAAIIFCLVIIFIILRIAKMLYIKLKH